MKTEKAWSGLTDKALRNLGQCVGKKESVQIGG